MIRKVEMEIINMKQIALDTFEMELREEYITKHASPGQFIYISLPGYTLRRPISIADINKEKSVLTVLFKVLGKGTEKLSEFKKGMTLDVIGPNGNGFPVEEMRGGTVVLIGGGIGVPPLYYLGKQLKHFGATVISVLGFQSKEHVFYEDAFSQIGETIIVTDDGSYGKKGFVTDILPDLPAFERFYSCGPKGMLKAVTEKLVTHNGYISLEERMGCGIGACSACIIPAKTEQGYKKICQSGPVFKAEEVIL